MQLNVKLNVPHHTTYGLRYDAKLQQSSAMNGRMANEIVHGWTVPPHCPRSAPTPDLVSTLCKVKSAKGPESRTLHKVDHSLRPCTHLVQGQGPTSSQGQVNKHVAQLQLLLWTLQLSCQGRPPTRFGPRAGELNLVPTPAKTNILNLKGRAKVRK